MRNPLQYTVNNVQLQRNGTAQAQAAQKLLILMPTMLRCHMNGHTI